MISRKVSGSPVSSEKRPLTVTMLACLYIGVGAIGFAYHFRESVAAPAGGIWVELTEALAFICGAFLLLGRNWARWAAMGWIGLHVILSAFGGVRECAIHALFCALFGWVLFRPAAARYFRGAGRVANPGTPACSL